jgi:hypothetical protein
LFVGLFLGVWGWVGLQLYQGEPKAVFPVLVTPPTTASTYPTVSWSGWFFNGPQVGDVLIRVGNADLRGVSRLGFLAKALEQAKPPLLASLVVERDGQRQDVVMDMKSMVFEPAKKGIVLLSILGSLIAVAILVRGRGSRAGRAFFVQAILYNFRFGTLAAGPAWQTYVLCGFDFLGFVVWPAAFLRMAALIPDSLPRTSRWRTSWPWLFCVPCAFFYLRNEISPVGWGPPLPEWVAYVAYAATFGSGLGVLTDNYRSSNARGRRQVRWFLFAVYLFVAPVLLAETLREFFDVNPQWFDYLPVTTNGLFLACVLIALIGYNLFDIDRLIGATAAYSVLLVLLLAGVFVLVPRVAVASSAFGIDPASSQMALSVALAALIVPAQRRLRPRLDRIFFAERHALESSASSLLRELSTCGGPQELFTRTGNRLDALLRPDSCVIYARAKHGFVPVFVHGHAVPSEHDADDPLIAVIRRREEPWRRSAGPFSAVPLR